jgi:hypothetical protein
MKISASPVFSQVLLYNNLKEALHYGTEYAWVEGRTMLNLRHKRKVRMEPKKNTFIVSYFVGDPCEVGMVQAFKIVEGQLFVLVFEERKRERNRTRWIPALCCSCREIIDKESLLQIIERDRVSEKDLTVIENFQKKLKEGKQNLRKGR